MIHSNRRVHKAMRKAVLVVGCVMSSWIVISPPPSLAITSGLSSHNTLNVSFLFADHGDAQSSHVCQAVFISPTLALSASHCVISNPDRMIAAIGPHHIISSIRQKLNVLAYTQENLEFITETLTAQERQCIRPIKQSIVHPYSDLAVIEIQEPHQFKNFKVLWNHSLYPHKDRAYTAHYHHQYPTPYIRYIEGYLVKNSMLHQLMGTTFDHYKLRPSQNVLVFEIPTSGTLTDVVCTGDSGSPVIWKSLDQQLYVVGIMSVLLTSSAMFAPAPGVICSPLTAFTTLKPHLKWLHLITKSIQST